MIGRLIKLSLRDVWAHEEDFSRYLIDHLDVLSEQLNLGTLTRVKQEADAGDFSVDILAEDKQGNLVVIENQLDKTNHDHLGKLLVYLTTLQAKTGIWISKEPRQEHIEVIQWLNENAPEDVAFYLVKLEACKVDESKPAAQFSLIAGPSEGSRDLGKAKKDIATRRAHYLEFKQELLDLAKRQLPMFKNKTPDFSEYVSAGVGKSGLALAFCIARHRCRVEFYMQRPTPEEAKKRFDALAKYREEIDQMFGESLDWDYNSDRKQNYVRSWIEKGVMEKEDWREIQEELVDRMVRLEKAVRPYIPEL